MHSFFHTKRNTSGFDVKTTKLSFVVNIQVLSLKFQALQISMTGYCIAAKQFINASLGFKKPARIGKCVDEIKMIFPVYMWNDE